MDFRTNGQFPVAVLVALAAAVGSPAGAEGQTAPGRAVSAGGSGVEVAMTQIAVGDFTFDVRTAGPEDGEVVILLHGFPQTSYEWRHQIRALAAAGFRAVAPDQRGYSPGARPPDVADYALPLLVQDVIGLADAVGAERFHIVGHDWGAVVAWAVAVAARDRVITANPVSVPHPDAFARVLNDPTSCQPQASSYFDVFVQPNSEDGFLANGQAGLRGIYAGIDEAAVDEYVRALGSKPALGAALNWYRANIGDRNLQGPALGPVEVPTMFTCERRRHGAVHRRRAAHRGVRQRPVPLRGARGRQPLDPGSGRRGDVDSSVGALEPIQGTLRRPDSG